VTDDEFLSHFEKVKQSNGQYVALCPAHEDRNPSLGIRFVDEKRLLLCRAGCRTENIVQAAGLRMQDLFEEKEITYDYTDEEGEILFQVVRSPGKRFRQRRMVEGDWVYNLDGVRRVLYRLPDLLAGKRAGKTIWVVEGEKDAETLRALGEVATTCPMGAGKWRDEYTETLLGSSVVIVADRDEPGEQHARTIHAALPGSRIVQARYGKDASDHFAGGGTLEDFLPLKESEREGILSGRGLADLTLRDLGITLESSVFYKNPWMLPEPEFVPGRLYVLGGATAGGKTSLALQVFRDLCERHHKPLYVSMEMSNRDLKNRFLCHKGFKIKDLERPWNRDEAWKESVRTHAEEFYGWEGEIRFSTTAGAAWCREIIREQDFDFLIFDHIHQVERVAGGEEGSIAQEIREFRNIALDYDIPVLALSQFKRPLQPGLPPTVYDFKGSSAIEQNATMAMTIHHDNTSYSLIILKNRDGVKGSYPLIFHGAKFMFKGASVASQIEEEDPQEWM
jgi:replicative DNA helicase